MHQAPLNQVAAEAEAPAADAAPSTAAQRRFRAAENGLRVGLESLDSICLEETLRSRVLTLQSVRSRLRGTLRTLHVFVSCMFSELVNLYTMQCLALALEYSQPPAKETGGCDLGLLASPEPTQKQYGQDGCCG